MARTRPKLGANSTEVGIALSSSAFVTDSATHRGNSSQLGAVSAQVGARSTKFNEGLVEVGLERGPVPLARSLFSDGVDSPIPSRSVAGQRRGRCLPDAPMLPKASVPDRPSASKGLYVVAEQPPHCGVLRNFVSAYPLLMRFVKGGVRAVAQRGGFRGGADGRVTEAGPESHW